MVIFIESLIGIILFTIIIVALTLKDPLTSVGDYPLLSGTGVWN